MAIFATGSTCVPPYLVPGGKDRAEEKLKLAQTEFKMPPLLTDAEIKEILTVLPDLTKWANEITAYATDAAVNHGKTWSGFKVVEGRSNHKYRDEGKVAEAAIESGYKDIYRQSLITLTEMQKLMGKEKFEAILGASFINRLVSRHWFRSRISVRL